MQQWKPGQPLQLQTKRLRFRTLVPADVNEDYLSWWNNPDIQAEFNMEPRGWKKEDAEKHVGTFNNQNRFHIGIFERQSNKLIGFFSILLKPKLKMATLNICIGNKDYRGKNIGLETFMQFFPFIFRRLGVAKIEHQVVGDDPQKLYRCKTAGFKKEGVLREEVEFVKGGRANVHLFGLLRNDWISENPAQ